MDKKIKALFELQKFIQEPSLEEVIKDTTPDFGCELSDDALFAVAGGKENNGGTKEQSGEKGVKGTFTATIEQEKK